MKYLLVFLFACSVIRSAAQDADRIVLEKARFHTGDDLAWNQPLFDDSPWQYSTTNANWDRQGYEDYDGFAWYRFHFNLPAALREGSFWKDSLRIFLAKIDDADEIFLNGTLLQKNGSFPGDPGGYVTAWNRIREIHLPADHPALRWDRENILAVRVYDGGGLGGMFGGIPFINMMDLIDGIDLDVAIDQGNGQVALVSIANRIGQAVEGKLALAVIDPEQDSMVQAFDRVIRLEPGTTHKEQIAVDPGQRLEVRASFAESNTGKARTENKVTPYILTPAPSEQPRINNAAVFGVRPHAPVLFKIAASGRKPMIYSVENLPAGLQVDENTGVITGGLVHPGSYRMTLVAKNEKGMATMPFTIRCGELLALTPPLGWNSWNCWGLSVSDEKVRSSAQALIDKGLADHGWTYINIDDGWEAEQRNAQGAIVTNEKFPDMKALGDWLHSKGLKFGIYSSPGPLTCGGYLGSYQHEEQDARTYNSWGIDYLKYDWCSYGNIHGGKDTTLASYQKPYQVMRQALRSQPRDILYSLCQYGMRDVWQWGHEVDGNLWRTTGDIEDTWESLRDIGFRQHEMSPYARPGRWNDPDMLIVGQVGWGEHLHPTRLTPDEQYTHISLWCLLSAPLLIGCDISRMDDFTVSLLCNDEVLALDQDFLGKQATRAITTDNYQIWVKELADGSRAVGIFNLSEQYQTIKIAWRDLQINGQRKVRDLWRQKDLGVFETFETRVPPHGVTLVKVE